MILHKFVHMYARFHITLIARKYIAKPNEKLYTDTQFCSSCLQFTSDQFATLIFHLHGRSQMVFENGQSFDGLLDYVQIPLGYLPPTLLLFFLFFSFFFSPQKRDYVHPPYITQLATCPGASDKAGPTFLLDKHNRCHQLCLLAQYYV
jgi:hypothetical protein